MDATPWICCNTQRRVEVTCKLFSTHLHSLPHAICSLLLIIKILLYFEELYILLPAECVLRQTSAVMSLKESSLWQSHTLAASAMPQSHLSRMTMRSPQHTMLNFLHSWRHLLLLMQRQPSG